MDELKQRVQGWDLSIKIRNEARQGAKKILREKEQELKLAKRIVYQTNKQWIEARKELKSAKSKLSSYPSYRRQWAKRNFGKVMDMIDKRNTQFCQGKNDPFQQFCAECKKEKKDNEKTN